MAELMERKKTKDMNRLSSTIDYLESNKEPLLKRDSGRKEGNLRNEKINIALLLFLYVLQGIPLGLGGSMPMILQNYKISYKQQALFSFVTWPFSVKLLWAPILDSIYSSKFGRRKSWLIPTQYIIGLTMMLLSSAAPSLLGNEETEPNVLLLTIVFFFLNFLAATQDIAVDGWALTMLSRQNVGYASTCNSVGQTAGYFFGNVVFLALESANFCNTYLRNEPQPEGLVTLSSFLMFWGIVFLISTTFVLILKQEKERHESDIPMNLKETYKRLFQIIRLPNMWTMIIFLMTSKIGFASDSATGLKLIEAGVSKERLALLAVPMVPVQILLPFVISRFTAGPRPMTVFLTAYPFRLAFGIVFSVFLHWTYSVKLENGEFPVYYYIVILIIYAANQITVYCMFVALMSFFARVSDPSIGGTYMTLLNTITNLGGNWPATLALWLLDPLTSKACVGNPEFSCDTKELESQCKSSGGHCEISVDGYYILSAFCVVFGFIWFRWGKPTALRLQQLPLSAWSH